MNDIALLKLNGRLDLNRTDVNSICLPSHQSINVTPQKATITGWSPDKDLTSLNDYYLIKYINIVIKPYDDANCDEFKICIKKASQLPCYVCI